MVFKFIFTFKFRLSLRLLMRLQIGKIKPVNVFWFLKFMEVQKIVAQAINWALACCHNWFEFFSVIFMRNNMVGTIIIVSLIIWIPCSCLVHRMDIKRKAECEKEVEFISSDQFSFDKNRIEVSSELIISAFYFC